MVLDNIAQSLRATGGSAFERVVAKILNEFLIKDNIVVVRARENNLRELIHNKTNLKRLMDFTKIPVKRKCDQSQLEDYPDLDLFVLIKPTVANDLWKLLAIISCKVSFHARHTEATFWGLLVRLTSNIPFVVVTEDRDIYKPKSSELGTSCTKSTSTRRLLESFADGVYLVKQYADDTDKKLTEDIKIKRQHLLKQDDSIVFDNPNIPNHTQYCHCVRPIDALINDLRRWKLEITDY